MTLISDRPDLVSGCSCHFDVLRILETWKFPEGGGNPKSAIRNLHAPQGDLIFDCPVIAWASGPLNLSGSEETEVLKAATVAIRVDVVVMTQACDLENNKVDNVILCPHISITDYRKAWEEERKRLNQNPTKKAWGSLFEDIHDGYIWNLTILNAGESGDLKLEHRIVDFHDVYTIPRSFLESLLRQRRHPRLRLNPPYREHLSQAFARFFMRVGLPVPVTVP